MRGIFEKIPGSGVFWIHYYDAEGNRRREKAGRKSAAIALYRKRKTEALEGKKLPKCLRQRPITLGELADEALEYSKAHKISHEDDVIRGEKVKQAFGSRTAESITPQDIERWFATQEKWKPATFNRYKALLSLIYRLGIVNGKVSVNPARLVKSRRENNARTRFLAPEEEASLRQKIEERCPERLPELDIALHTGLRRSEQYGLTWDCVDLDRRGLTIRRSKHGEKRHVFLNDAALAAFQTLWKFSKGKGRVFSNGYFSEKTKGAREWFEECVLLAGIKDFTWHDLRHTFASRLTMKGAGLIDVKEAMGHKTIQVTLRYSHLAPKHQLATVQLLCEQSSDNQQSSRSEGAKGEVAATQERTN